GARTGSVLMRVPELPERLAAAGAGPGHAYRVLRLWSNALPQDSGKRRTETFLPASLLSALPSIELDLGGLARLRSAHPSADGGERLLVELADGQTVESV